VPVGCSDRQEQEEGAGFDWQALRHHLDSPSLFSATRLIELCLGESGPGVQGPKAIIACAERPPTGDVVLITAAGLDAKARQSAWYRALDT
jgi:DNA polymerase III subunit delta